MLPPRYKVLSLTAETAGLTARTLIKNAVGLDWTADAEEHAGLDAEDSRRRPLDWTDAEVYVACQPPGEDDVGPVAERLLYESSVDISLSGFGECHKTGTRALSSRGPWKRCRWKRWWSI